MFHVVSNYSVQICKVIAAIAANILAFCKVSDLHDSFCKVIVGLQVFGRCLIASKYSFALNLKKATKGFPTLSYPQNL